MPSSSVLELLSPCRVCARACGADRLGGEKGFCGLDAAVHVAWAGPHLGEEPCFSGQNGVGNVFFSSCNMACAYCQNHQISQGGVACRAMEAEQFADLALSLQESGVHFLGLVSPGHQAPQVAQSLETARKRGLCLPVLYNTNAYESVEALKLFDGLVEVYLPDVKYAEDANAVRYSRAPGYARAWREAVAEMHRQAGDIRLDLETGLAQSG
ncbi:MAG: radical SAM protein, partial [Deltaproteobacteria bacterium]|nr:radical SAM protein [Deltaproteobacteria bacterium]